MPRPKSELETEELTLYTSYAMDKDGNIEVLGYAYGAPWVHQALLMDDIKFATPEEAKAWWEKNYGGESNGCETSETAQGDRA